MTNCFAILQVSSGGYAVVRVVLRVEASPQKVSHRRMSLSVLHFCGISRSKQIDQETNPRLRVLMVETPSISQIYAAIP